jgi:hypothetical protein
MNTKPMTKKVAAAAFRHAFSVGRKAGLTRKT